MDEHGFWALIRKRWISILIFGVLGCLGGSAYFVSASPEYSAEAELFVSAVGGQSASDLAQAGDYSQQQARNFSVVATRGAVLDPVVKSLDLNMSAKELGHHVSATVPLNTSIISITVTDGSAQQASIIANAIAHSLTDSVADLTPKRSNGSSPIKLHTVQRALVPSAASAPNRLMSVGSGIIIGIIVGLALVVLRELVGAKVRTADQVKQITGSGLLGSVVADRGTSNFPMASQDLRLSPRAEEYRQIRTNLHFVKTDESNKVFIVTSAMPGEGKSVTSANVAAAAAAAGHTVCLVEADLRMPKLGDFLDLESGVGFTTVLANDVHLDDALQPWGPDGLQVLLSGGIPPNPSELLESAAAEKLLKGLNDRFEIVVVDCPPVVPVTDAAILAGMFGGAVMVVGIGKGEVRDLRRAVESLKGTNAPILGAIVNFAPRGSRRRYRKGYGQSPTREGNLLSAPEQERSISHVRRRDSGQRDFSIQD